MSTRMPRPQAPNLVRLARRGFSLVELVLVLAMIGVVAAIAAPRFARANNGYRADLAARRIVADLAYAARKARAASKPYTVTFNTAAASYQLVNVSDIDRSTQPYVVKLAAEPYGVRMTSASFGGAPQATFDGYGMPTSAGTVVVRAGDAVRTVTLDAITGRVVVQ
jgi:prepilin-type N-terminal cleavage/methylation domain-containing protein